MQRVNVLTQHIMAAEVRESKAKILNFNVGVLGHIDSGKTSLGRCFNLLHELA